MLNFKFKKMNSLKKIDIVYTYLHLPHAFIILIPLVRENIGKFNIWYNNNNKKL